MKLTCLLCAACFFLTAGFAQTTVSGFGNFTNEDFDLKECSFDKNADAVVIFDKALSNYNDEHNLVTERRIRFKILKEKGIERGNIHIRFYSKDKFEYINKISGITATPDPKGTVWTKLDPKTIYTRKLNEINSEVVFAMPNVKVGTIIEYEYESVMEHYGGLDDWYFQQEMPVMLSSYTLYIIPNVSFNYLVKKSSALKITIEPHNDIGNVLFEMKNVPGLRDEAYSTSYRDYLQRVTFQLSEVHYRGSVSRYSNNWKELTRNLMEDKYFGVQINKNISTPASLLMNAYPDQYSKMQFIHNYVRKNFDWNDMYSLSCIDGLKSVVDKKRGTAGELNLLMINMLKDAGLEVYPVLVSERWHGVVDSSYSFRDQFNKVVALVLISDKKYVLDATDNYTPSNMIPTNLLNTLGFIVDKKNSGFIHLVDNNKRKLSFVSWNGTITPDAAIKAEAAVDYYDYARVGKAEQYNSSKQKYTAQFSNSIPGLKVDSFTVTGVENDSVSLHHNMVIEYPLTKSGSYYLMNYNLFTGFEKNPFIADYRFTDIDFGAKYSCVLQGKITVPEQFIIDALPKDMTIRTGDKGLQAMRQIRKNNNMLEISLRIDFNTPCYPAGDYFIVKDFFSKMIDLLNEPVVLKSK